MACALTIFCRIAASFLRPQVLRRSGLGWGLYLWHSALELGTLKKRISRELGLF
jgi:hypothetical protein